MKSVNQINYITLFLHSQLGCNVKSFNSQGRLLPWASTNVEQNIPASHRLGSLCSDTKKLQSEVLSLALFTDAMMICLQSKEKGVEFTYLF